MEKFPYIYSIKPMKEGYSTCNQLYFRSKEITIGRSLDNTLVLSHLSVSRKHCKIQQIDDKWMLQDTSFFGILINGNKITKGVDYELKNDDIIQMDPNGEIIYKYVGTDDCEIPRKRIKRESSSEIINNMKVKFEESQSIEKEYLEEKITNAKMLQTNTIIIKKELEQNMARQIAELKLSFAVQIENLKGEKNEVERQKSALEEERDNQLASIKLAMEEKISQLLEQIQKHNQTESELVQENNLLKEKLIKDREEFLTELNRECSSKQDMLEQLEGKIREQEEARLKEKQEFEDNLKTKTEQLQAIKEKELQDLEEQKRLRELELQLELSEMRKKAELAEIEKTKTEQQLLDKIEDMSKQNEKIIKMNELKEKERELVQLKAESAQVRQSTEITALNIQLDTMRSKLASVETEKKVLQGNKPNDSTDQDTIQKVQSVMEAELQCCICSELFLSATTLNCSHTFCSYCIKKWRRASNECPHCRTEITTENRSLALDSFIERMAGLTDEMKLSRLQIVKEREELEAEFNREVFEPRRREEEFEEYEYDSEYGEERDEEEYSDYELPRDEWDHEQWDDDYESQDISEDESQDQSQDQSQGQSQDIDEGQLY